MPESDTESATGWNQSNTSVTIAKLDESTVDRTGPVGSAQRYLTTAYESVSGFLTTTFPAVRQQREGARGRVTHSEHDVLRAAVVFAGAGVDAVVQEALRSCVPVQIATSSEAQKRYLVFVERYLRNGDEIDTKKLAGLLIGPTPDAELREVYIAHLTGSSLQSRTQVTNSLSALGMSDKRQRDLFRDADTLNELFKIRNQIAHEMDIKTSEVRRGRRTRTERPIGKYGTLCHTGLNYCQRMLNELQAEIGQSRTGTGRT